MQYEYRSVARAPQTSKMKSFAIIVNRILVVNYCCKSLHLVVCKDSRLASRILSYLKKFLMVPGSLDPLTTMRHRCPKRRLQVAHTPAVVTQPRPKSMYFVNKKFLFPTKLKPSSKSFQFWRWRLKFDFYKKCSYIYYVSVFKKLTVSKGS